MKTVTEITSATAVTSLALLGGAAPADALYAAFSMAAVNPLTSPTLISAIIVKLDGISTRPNDFIDGSGLTASMAVKVLALLAAPASGMVRSAGGGLTPAVRRVVKRLSVAVAAIRTARLADPHYSFSPYEIGETADFRWSWHR